MSSNGKSAPLLSLRDINTHYGQIHILQNVNLEVYSGELICLLGGNASGKSTTLKTILGIVRPTSGVVEFAGEAVQMRPTGYRVERGMAVVPENRRIFGPMSVLENLQMGSYLRHDKEGIHEDLERILKLFPRLKERLKQLGGTLSGGEQQMLAIGRALMGRPQLICMDEPTMGLSPAFVDNVLELIQTINGQGTAIFMVEQNANLALQIAHRGYVLQNGHIVLEGAAKDLLDSREVQDAYLGGQTSVSG